jgi:ribosomal protein L11 methyltransferase
MWYQLQIDLCPSDEIEKLSESLENIGALAVTFTDKFDKPILEPELGTTTLWPDVIVSALFDDELLACDTKKQLMTLHPHLVIIIETVAHKNWQQEWMATLKPQRFGHNLWICPSWLTPPDPNAINLILDPGLAFGTGSHPTTSLCLTWLDKTTLVNKTVIDYGCGSGILAIAAIKLGALHVHAVDIDTQALQATENNALLNNIKLTTPDSHLTISLPNALHNRVDIIIANILLQPLMVLKTDFHTLCVDGLLVVSGILITQVPLLIETYTTYFVHQETHYLEDWALLVFSYRC